MGRNGTILALVFVLTALLAVTGCESDSDSSDSSASPVSRKTVVAAQPDRTAAEETASDEPAPETPVEPEDPEDPEAPEPRPLPFRQVGAPFMPSRFPSIDIQTLVIRNHEEWIDACERYGFAFVRIGADPYEPPCDFAEEMLVVRMLGWMNGCAPEFNIEEVFLFDGALIIVCRTTSRPRGPGDMICHVISPLAWAACVPNLDVPVEIVDRHSPSLNVQEWPGLEAPPDSSEP